MASEPSNKQIDAFDQASNAAEDSILGALFVDPSILSQIQSCVSPSDFYRPHEREVYRLICEMQPTSGEAIYQRMRVCGLTSSDYGPEWFAMLITRASTHVATSYSAPDLKRLSQLRQLQNIFKRSLEPNADPSQIVTTSLLEVSDWQSSSTLAPEDYCSVYDTEPDLHKPVIAGILREGETANIIAAPKVGKSFLSVNLAWCVATGRPWLSHDVQQGRVLIIDNELHRPTLTNRIHSAANAFGIENDERRGLIDVLSLRGQNCDIHALHRRLISIPPGTYKLVVLDALYRTLPAGTSENDNAMMMAIYNRLDQYADHLRAAVVVVHHSSKGGQGEKSITDVGAGAGSISRAADTHIAIRPHETDGHCVLEAVTRSFKSPEPVSICFEYPLWHATTLTPEVRRIGQAKADKQAKEDAEADEILRQTFEVNQVLSESQIVRATGMGPSRTTRAVGRAVAAGFLESKRVRRQGRKVTVFRRTATATATAKSDARS